MKYFSLLIPVSCLFLQSVGAAEPAAPAFPRPLRDLRTDYFPMQFEGPITSESWARRKQEVKERVLLASGLFPLPAKTPLNAVIHGRVTRDDYTIDRVFFESFPGHYVSGNLYLPKNPPPGGKMPGILSPHGHWANGRFTINETKAALDQLAIGAERFESGARAPLQARCVQLARMGCAVFIYDMLGNGDSIQISEHRSGQRPELNGTALGTFGLYSPMADLRLESNFGLQTWNSIRALDFLLTVPGVDPTRLACTGESGGGTQTMMIAAVDDRLAAAFPCVMVSTAMQGGCTCENACYLRINQGNIDIAAAFAPKPMGVTAADDWTRELETKGYPDMKAVWTKLGQPDNLTATFNIHWKHNYNHVSRTTMYGFMNKHFKLGFSMPVLERDFVLSTIEDMTVWTKEHPKPSGAKVGGAHEKALLAHWSQDSDRQIAANREVPGRAWEMIVGRTMPTAADVSLAISSHADQADGTQMEGIASDLRHQEQVPFVLLRPKGAQWKGTTAVWLRLGGGQPAKNPAVKKLLAAGVAVVYPTLYLPNALEQPMGLAQSKVRVRHEWRWSAPYVYGYNHSLVAHRVHDTMTLVATLNSQAELRPTRVILVGSDGGGPIAAVAAATMVKSLQGAVIDTEGFRFASLNDQWDPMYMPGAVKYGDLPGLFRLAEPLRPALLGENGAPGGAENVVAAVLKSS